ncbi:MAG TPA: DnaA N-terminal domain-containing protein [Candidatus Hydrogenedentes bacterium]|nr:DnaA N-terminal domain-containing protein [Candidatus Hydrogenedentota bacterium]
MNPQEIWESVLTQLQQEMPRASFETWVRDTDALSLEHNLLTVSARNVYARDWLESRVTNPVQRILQELLQKPITVRFVDAEGEQEIEIEEEETLETEVAIEPVQWLDYEKIVQPHRQVVVKGYLRRLAMEIGPKAIWLYIGFHQAAWKAHALGRESALPSRDVLRFSGLSEGAFWRLMKDPDTHYHLNGLVQRMNAAEERRFRRGRDGRPHRAPIRYQVSMTPRLTRADAATLHVRLRAWLAQGASLSNALQDLLNVEPVQKLLEPVPEAHCLAQVDTVMDMARLEAGESVSPEIEHLAQELHRKIINCLGDIHLTHYFIEQVIPSHNLTPAQAWLVAVARDMAYVNARTGERRDIVTFKRGYLEMAELIGSQRYKTVQGWLHPEWRLRRHGGDVARFLQEQPVPDAGYSDLRTDSMPRSFRVLLDEPLDANGGIRADANGGIRLDADGGIRQTRMEGLVDANGGNMVDANGGDLNTIKHPINTDKKNTSTTQHGEKQAEAAAPPFWELESLLQQNDVHPKVQRELLEVQASVHAFVSWLLYVASPQSGNLSDPLGYALSRLREHPLKEARGVFRQFADLPPVELLGLIDSTSSGGYQLPPTYNHPLAPAWKKAMGATNRRLPAVRAILFGEREEQ